jgi:hypothetical protein
VFEDDGKELNSIAVFTSGEKKFYLPYKISLVSGLRFYTLDEAERRIAKEVYYNTKQILFVDKTLFGKEV